MTTETSLKDVPDDYRHRDLKKTGGFISLSGCQRAHEYECPHCHQVGTKGDMLQGECRVLKARFKMESGRIPKQPEQSVSAGAKERRPFVPQSGWDID